MALSKAINGLGATLSIGSGGGTETFTVVGEITDISQAGRKMETIEITHLLSTGKEYLATMIDNGTWDISGNLIDSDAGQTSLETTFAAGTTRDFKVTFPKTATQTTAGDVYAFAAIVTEKNIGKLQVKGAVTFTAKLLVTGPITLTAGT